MTNAIDDAHCALIYGLAVSLKPKSVLELGYGEGASARALWAAMQYNANGCRYTLVDDWRGHDGQVLDAPPLLGVEVEILSMPEEEFYRSTVSGSYDLILSDADHEHADQWFDQSLAMVRAPGLLIYHDVTNPNHPNLTKLILEANLRGYSHLVFNRSSRADEACERGLLVISKP